MVLLYADEHVPLAVIKALRRAGHDVVRALDRYGEGTDDLTHFESAVRENRVFLTQDTDFLALSSAMLSEGKHHPGVVYWPQGVYRIGQVIRKLKQYLETTTPDSRMDLVKFL
jgi:hypothetical protein